MAQTYAHVGSAPYWCWGYEMGINEHGLAIGNEATYSRDLADRATKAESGESYERGLVGMEVLRLALERARTGARSASTTGSGRCPTS